MHCHHEKTIVVDDRVAFVGGIDLTDESGDRYDWNHHPPRADVGWHDACARFEGPAVADVAEVADVVPASAPGAARTVSPTASTPAAAPVATTPRRMPRATNLMFRPPRRWLCTSRRTGFGKSCSGLDGIPAAQAAEHPGVLETDGPGGGLDGGAVADQMFGPLQPEELLVPQRREAG